MNVGMVGLGRMGMGMGSRLASRGHGVTGFDASDEKKEEAARRGIAWADSPKSLCDALPTPRVEIIMVPAGSLVDEVIGGLIPHLASKDLVIDGGNSFYKDSIRRGNDLASHGICFLDAGVSGGVWGEDEGYCLMVGGDLQAYEIAEPLFRDLSEEGGYAHVGELGAGHFSKMAHNGIEYAMLEAYGEGLEILKSSRFNYDLPALCDLWNHGGVVRSWLLELARIALDDDKDLASIRGYVPDSGEGRWTVMESIDESVPCPAIALSLMMRFRSQQDDSFSAKVIAALRNQFGGHPVKKV